MKKCKFEKIKCVYGAAGSHKKGECYYLGCDGEFYKVKSVAHLNQCFMNSNLYKIIEAI